MKAAYKQYENKQSRGVNEYPQARSQQKNMEKGIKNRGFREGVPPN